MKILNIKKSTVAKTKRHAMTLSASLLYVLSAGHPVLAEDTEVFFGADNQTNVLFILDTSESMRDVVSSDPENRTRLAVVKSVFEDLMNNEAYQGLNVAVMRFDSRPRGPSSLDGSQGGYFISPMQQLNGDSRDSIIAASNALTPSFATPLSETFYEAALFWRGMAVDYGGSSRPANNVDGVSLNGRYISPITSQCQKNFTILLTDGAPGLDNDAVSKIEAMTGSSCSGNCLDELADYLKNTNQNAGIADSTVETFTIGFETDQDLLRQTGRAGGGTPTVDEDGDLDGGNSHSFTVNNADELSKAFIEALGDGINVNAANFSPPALAANAFNGISHYNKLYFSLFKPATTPKWNGNVKPYALNTNNQLVGIGGNLAIDEQGAFTTDSRSFWSANVDAGNIVAGGANGRLPAADERQIYTYIGAYNDATETPNTTLSELNEDNTELTSTMLGLPGDATAEQRNTIIANTRNFKLGAPLHSQPALVTYGGDTADEAIMTLFVATNDGFLHAFNANPGAEGTAEGGKELFAFIPQELLPKLSALNSDAGNTVYGLDGNISVWVKESDDNDRTIESGDDDHVFVYVGQRRGGNNYYALDVTTRTTPSLKWVIQGGDDLGSTAGFEELGQSWSTPKLTTIKYGSSGSKKVLIFGGGYDPRQDGNPRDTDDTIGRAIFIVDADNGTLLWSAGSETFSNSIPSDVAFLDSNLDGTTDRLYVGDMRGQVFRVDLEPSGSGVTGTTTHIASLGGADEANNRRFYYAPDVVVTQRRGTAPYVSINIGSGYRAHPLNPVNPNGTAATLVNDRFYSLRDRNVVGPIPGDTEVPPLTHRDLTDVTRAAVLSDGQTTILNSNASKGWYITLAGSGEKVLAPAITVNSEIFFTSYTPPALTANSNCVPSPGTGRLYRVSLFDATPVADQTGDDDINDTGDRYNDTSNGGIPAGPTSMFKEDDTGNGNVDMILCEGTSCEVLPGAIQMQKDYWREESS